MFGFAAAWSWSNQASRLGSCHINCRCLLDFMSNQMCFLSSFQKAPLQAAQFASKKLSKSVGGPFMGGRSFWKRAGIAPVNPRDWTWVEENCGQKMRSFSPPLQIRFYVRKHLQTGRLSSVTNRVSSQLYQADFDPTKLVGLAHVTSTVGVCWTSWVIKCVSSARFKRRHCKLLSSPARSCPSQLVGLSWGEGHSGSAQG